MINQDKPTSSISNNTKTSIGETWGSIDSTWQDEVRSWLQVSQLLSNFDKTISTLTNQSKP